MVSSKVTWWPGSKVMSIVLDMVDLKVMQCITRPPVIPLHPLMDYYYHECGFLLLHNYMSLYNQHGCRKGFRSGGGD